MAKQKLKTPLFYKGEMYFKKGQLALSKQLFTRCIHLNQSVVESQYYIALIYYYQSRYEDAFKRFQEILMSGKKNGDIDYFLGKIYQFFEDPEEAERHFQKTLTMQDNETIQLLAYLELSKKSLMSQEKELLKQELLKHYLIQVEVKEDEDLMYQGIRYQLLEDYDKSIESFQKLIKNYPHYFQGYYQLAQTYLKMNLYEDAYQQFIILKNRFKMPMISLMDLSKLNFELKYYKQAKKALQNYIRLNSVNYKTNYRLGLLSNATKKFGKAINYYLESIRLKSDFFASLYNLAVTYQKVGKADEALEYYQKALQLNISAPDIYYNMGLIYFVKNDYINSLFNFTKAYQINPDFEEAYNNFYYISLIRVLDADSSNSYEFSLALKVSIILGFMVCLLLLIFYLGGF